MSGDFPIFRTKLTPPQLKQTVLRRPALMKKLRGIPDFPLTLVHSGPGYGKSTALASFLKDRDDFCWYTVSSSDDEIILFLHYFLEALRSRLPGFGERILRQLKELTQKDDLRAICAELVNALSTLDKPLILIIDDYHLIAHSSAIEEWLLAFIENMPANVHLVLSSRARPTWQLLTALKAKGNLLEMAESDFTFTYDEVDVLFSDFYEIRLNDGQIKAILQKTEGWVMAIQMMGQQLSGKEELDKILDNETRSLADLFHFLALEVLSKQPEAIQQFLRQTCIFEELSAPVLNHVLNIRDADRHLKTVVNENLFLFSLGEGQFRYHALFKDFLLRDLKKDDPDLFTRLHRRSGSFFKEKQLFEQAIFHYEAIEDYESAAEILYFFGETMIRLGLLEGLKEKLDALPFKVKNRFETLWIYEGDIHRYRCHYDQALACYERAERRTAEKGNEWGEALALEGMARVYLDTIQPARAEGYLKKAVEMITEKGPLDERQIRLYRLMAENLVNLGRAREAEQWRAKATPASDDFQNGNLEARLFLRTGRLQEAASILQEQKQRERGKGEHLQQSHRETDLLLSLIHSFQGDALEAKTLAQEGIMRGVKYKAPFVEACGWMRIGHAVQLSSGYELDQALACYETSLRLMDDIHVPRGKAEPLMGLCSVYTQKGDFETAWHYGERALAETEKVNDDWLSALIRLCLNMAAFYEGDFERCNILLAQCDEAFERCGDPYGLTVSLLWKTLVAFEEKDMDGFESVLEDFLKKVEANHYECILESRTLFGPFDLQMIPPLLLEAQRREIGGNNVSYLLKRLGISERSTPPGYTLYVQMLGTFRVWLGNKELRPEDWRRDKARELFQLLVTRRHQRLAKEEILSFLWPDQEGATASAGLKVAFNTLNKVLEPQRKARQTPYFIERHEASYQLNLRVGFQLDVAEFEQQVSKGLEEQEPERAIGQLEKGLSYYNGDYLSGRRFEDWCLEERERIQVLFLRGSEQLARLYVKIEDYDQAIRRCEDILKKDRCWEAAYRLLMVCYYRSNNRPQAIKWYRKCCAQLEKELGVEPMVATQEMYDQILEETEPHIHGF